jgi:Holliday junction DNA helicase RuvA
MIATLNGTILAKAPTSVILDVAGVGYELLVSGRTYDALPETGGTCFLRVQTVVREDAITLYGFSKQEEKDMFLLLVSVSGIGPKLAQTILSGISVQELCNAIRSKDILRLTALPGVGKKTAQRLCVELGEKTGALDGGDIFLSVADKVPVAGAGDVLADAASALVNLGYSQQIAWQALRHVRPQIPGAAEEPRVEELIRLALQTLAGK